MLLEKLRGEALGEFFQNADDPGMLADVIGRQGVGDFLGLAEDALQNFLLAVGQVDYRLEAVQWGSSAAHAAVLLRSWLCSGSASVLKVS